MNLRRMTKNVLMPFILILKVLCKIIDILLTLIILLLFAIWNDVRRLTFKRRREDE